MNAEKLPLFRDRAARKVIEAACAERGLTIELLQELLDVQRKYAGSGRSHGITADYDAAISMFIEMQDDLSGAA